MHSSVSVVDLGKGLGGGCGHATPYFYFKKNVEGRKALRASKPPSSPSPPPPNTNMHTHTTPLAQGLDLPLRLNVFFCK